MDSQSYGALLAQVIPVVLLAVIIDTRQLHQVWQTTLAKRVAGGNGEAPPPSGKLLLGQLSSVAGVVVVYVVLEVNALATAAGQQRANYFTDVLSNPKVSAGLIAGGFLLVQAFNAVAIMHTYRMSGAVGESSRLTLQWILRLTVVLVLAVASPLIWK